VEASPTLVTERPVSANAATPADGAALLYERYYDRVFGYCLYQLGSREEAEDVAQTTFMRAYRGLRRGVVPRAEARWLFTIAQNACRARHRSRGRKRAREVLSDPVVLADVSPAHVAETDELVGLEDALARMPDLQRRAILLREWRGLSYKEIAAELELSDAAVETLIFRARRTLAELLAGKPAPKRARKFAFFPGAIAAFKALVGPGTVGKVAAGFAAALIATTVVGSQETPAPKPRADRGTSVAVVPLRPKSEKKAKGTRSHKPVKSVSSGAPSTSHSSEKPATPSPSKPIDSPPAPVQAVAGGAVTTVRATTDQTVKTVTDALAPVTDALAPVTGAVPELPVELP
jgi:RNA polymerase sigma-70 factor (ECF subfamily)